MNIDTGIMTNLVAWRMIDWYLAENECNNQKIKTVNYDADEILITWDNDETFKLKVTKEES